MLEGDSEVQARAGRVEAMLRHVCDEEEFPYFVSDEATLFDVCTLTPEEIVERLASHYERKVHPKELRLPIWQLVDWLDLLR
jgi:hypothetical protein